MRIRSIKPEFWKHPIMTRLPDEVRLAAIGLLNVADDEGYFLANPAQVRSELWPLDECSSKARRVLAHLLEVGWLELRESRSHGLIGKIANFTKHQKVDRPNQSKIKTYFLDEQSTNVRRLLDDGSSLYQGSREQGSRDLGSEGSAPEDDLSGDATTMVPSEESERSQTPVAAIVEPWHEAKAFNPHIKAIIAAGGKCGEGNYLAWLGVIDRHGSDAVLAAIPKVNPDDRWPQDTEKVLIQLGQQVHQTKRKRAEVHL